MDEYDARQQLQNLIGAPKLVAVTRDIPDEPRLNGFVAALGREWVLLQQLYEFYLDGYAAVRLADITDFCSGDEERIWERMLDGEGVLSQVTDPDKTIPLDNISQLLQAFRWAGENIIVECEIADDDLDSFYIGEVLSVDENSVSFANFDTVGKWDEEPHIIPFSKITKVQFQTPYVRIFSKYLDGPYRRTD